MTLGRDKPQRNPSLNFKGISFVISNIVTSNIVTSNIVTSNIVTSNIVTSNIVTSNIVTLIKIFGVRKYRDFLWFLKPKFGNPYIEKTFYNKYEENQKDPWTYINISPTGDKISLFFRKNLLFQFFL